MRNRLLKKIIILLCLSIWVLSATAQKREIALTIDDLPFVGEAKNFHLNMIIQTLKENEIPVTGFVIAREVEPNNWSVLQKFHDAGFGLGNHTFSHQNLNRVPTQTYIQEIDSADKILTPLLTEPKFFRYPYLAMSQGQKKEEVLHYLSSKNYQIAPITVDSKDFMFNQLLLGVPEKARRQFLELLKPSYLDFIWQQTLKAEEQNRQAHKTSRAQILLIHSNLLNAYVLPDIINLFKQNGYNFVRLEEALKEPDPNVKLATKEKKLGDESIENYMDWD